MKDKLTAKDLQTLLKVNARKVTRWLNHTPPMPRIRRGGRYFYDPAAVSEWLVGVGFSDYAEIMENYLRSLAVNVKPKKEKSKVEKFVKTKKREEKKALANLVVSDDEPEVLPVAMSLDENGAVGVYQTLAIVSRRLLSHEKYLDKCADKFKMAGMKMTLQLSKEVRSLDESCLKMDIATAKVVPTSEVTKYIVDIGTKIKSELLTFPSAVASVLAGMNDEDEIEAYLDARVKSVLRHLATEFKAKE